MNIKEYLQKAFRLNVMIDTYKQQLEQFRALIDSVMPIIKNNSSLMTKTKAYEASIKTKIDRCMHLKVEIQNTIAAVEDDRDRHLLQKRYIECKAWNVIADEMYYSDQYIQKLHQKILQKISL